MNVVVIVLGAAAAVAAVIQLFRIREGQGPKFRRARLNLLAVISGSLMVIAPFGLDGILGASATTAIALGLGVLGLGLLFAGERVRTKD